ncbi:MAG: hypothetical protein U5L10_04685 [Candidatus Moranbacteria bacterium]|nr:hypothetical protein [Candidatus Moranbacteria bacterium]
MQISKDLPQFNIKEALIIVSAKHGLELYRAYQGSVEKLESFEVENPRYSDKEGFFMSRGKNVGTIRAGTVGEIKDGDIKRDFFQKLKDFLKNHREQLEGCSEIYLFAPDTLITELKEEMPENIQKKIFMEFAANYHKSHPFKVLEKIDKALTKKIDAIKSKPQSEEEKKILEIGKDR